MFLDGGGTIVLPDRHLVADGLRRVGLRIDPANVPRAHYRAVADIDREGRLAPNDGYGQSFCAALGVPSSRLAFAVAALSELGGSRREGSVLWSELAPGAAAVIRELTGTGRAVMIVTNSDGHAAENMRAAGILDQIGLSTAAVVDSEIVGSMKPDRRIFEVALAAAGVQPGQAVHVGDMLTTDVRGASAMGVTPIHIDPYRYCRSGEHRHVRSLRGLWAHVRRRS